MILGDVDFFNRYNDSYGHLAGDRCLQQVADVLRQTAKRPTELTARYESEEFAMPSHLLPLRHLEFGHCLFGAAV